VLMKKRWIDKRDKNLGSVLSILYSEKYLEKLQKGHIFHKEQIYVRRRSIIRKKKELYLFVLNAKSIKSKASNLRWSTERAIFDQIKLCFLLKPGPEKISYLGCQKFERD
jgi:hypothetical protein